MDQGASNMSIKQKSLYKKRILAYIDILGFKKLIDYSIRDKNIFNNIQKYLGSMNKFFLNDTQDFDFYNCCDFQCIQFSDTFVASIDSTENNEIIIFLNKIMVLISTLAYDGILSRGSIVYENLYHNNHIIYGPGIIDAYIKELNYAFYPRIIIDKQVISMINADLSRYYTSMDIDGLYYLDFIRSFWRINDYKNVKYHAYRIKNTIQNGIFNESLSVRQKYEWVKSKYNKYILDIHELTKDIPRLSKKYKELFPI
jgi:hypothetical protein